MTDLEQNKNLVTAAIALLSGRQPELFAEDAFAAEYVDHGAPDEIGPARILKIRSQLLTAFPDLTHEIEAIVAEGDLVVVRVVLRGTHDGPFEMGRPIAPTHRRVELRSMHMIRVADGQCAEHWVFRDDVGLMRQLGALPTPPPTRAAEARPPVPARTN